MDTDESDPQEGPPQPDQNEDGDAIEEGPDGHQEEPQEQDKEVVGDQLEIAIEQLQCLVDRLESLGVLVFFEEALEIQLYVQCK